MWSAVERGTKGEWMWRQGSCADSLSQNARPLLDCEAVLLILLYYDLPKTPLSPLTEHVEVELWEH